MSSNAVETLTMDSRLTLSDGNCMPRLGLGTWRSESGKVQEIVCEAILHCHYRMIDGAWIYQNENEVGNGIHQALEQSDGQIRREDLFITTKLWNQHHATADVEWACRDSLEKLRLDYLDLYLIHWPVAWKNISDNRWSQNEEKTVRYFAEGVTLEETWKAMERLVDLRLVRSIGLSNFQQTEIEEILRIARIRPVVNQIELHPFLNQKEMRDFCRKENIVITSYSPLANLKRENEKEEDVCPLFHPLIKTIATTKKKTPAQILLRWHLQHQLTVIPKTITPQRLRENCQLYDFHLTDEEMNQIDQLEMKHRRRFINPPSLPPGFRKVFDE